MMQQIVPQFTERRALFEAREGPSKMFSWTIFLLSAIITEAVGQTLLSVLAFALFYYPMGMFLDIPTEEEPERAALMFLFFLMFLLLTSTFSRLLTVGMDHRETIVNIGALLFYLILIFCGVLVAYDELPKFWTFMYWLSPLTYLIRGMFAVSIAHKTVECSTKELILMVAPRNLTCHEYFGSFVASAGGALSDPNAVGACSFCPLARTDELLKIFKIEYRDRWLNLGVMFIYIGFNVAATFGVYWLARVPKDQRIKKA
jgi:ATP-binding cassette subfamily G (WHITE) protein 2 (PDR)